MDQQMAADIMTDFLAWSGGSPPESKFEIFTYIEAACPFTAERERVWELLMRWMREGENDEFRYVDGAIVRDSSGSR